MASEFLMRMAAQERQKKLEAAVLPETETTEGAATAAPKAQPSAFLQRMVAQERERAAATQPSRTPSAFLQQMAEQEASDKAELEAFRLRIGYDDQAAQNGWTQFEADREKKKQEDANKSVWLSLAEQSAWTSGYETRTGAALGQKALNYRQDASYREPTQEWRSDWKQNFGFLYQKDPAEAAQYAIAVNNAIAKKKFEAEQKKVADSATGSVGAGLAHTAGALLTAPLGIADYLDNIAEASGRGTITQKDKLSPFDYSQAATAGVSKKLNELGGTIPEDVPVVGGKGWGDAYQLGFSAAQSLIAGTLGGGAGAIFSTVQYFGQAAAAGVDEQLDAKATAGQAIAYGMVCGIAEGAAEYVGIDNLLKIGSAATIKALLKNVFKQGAAEGMEEALTSVINRIADGIIMSDKSKYARSVTEYSKTMSPEDAKMKAFLDILEEVAFDALGGFVTGGANASVITGIHSGSDSRFGRKYLTDYAQGLVQLGLKAQEGTPGNTLAQEYQQKLAKGEKLSGLQLTMLFKEIAQQSQNDPAGILGTAIREQMSNAEKIDADPAEQQGQQEQTVSGLRLPTVGDDTAVTDQQENVTQPGQSVTQEQENVTQPGQSVTQEQENVTQLPVAGAENISVAEQLRRQNENGGNINVNTQGQNAGLTAAGNADTAAGAGSGLLLGGRQRLDSTGTGKQTGGVASQAGPAAQGRSAVQWNKATVDRINRIGALRLTKTSSAELGLQSGTDAKNIRLVPQEHWDAEMHAVAERVYRETGKRVSFVMGAIQVKGADGRVRNVNGVIFGDDIVVRADHMRLSMQQIADHESYHAHAAAKPGLNRTLRRYITERYSKEEFNAVMQKYADALEGVYDMADGIDGEAFETLREKVLEEVLADAYAGINVFSADQFTTAVNERMEQQGYRNTQTQENGVRETNGPPMERFSIDVIEGEKGNYGVGVILDTNLFNGIRPRAWGDVLSRYVYENLAGAELTVYDEQGNRETIYIAENNDRVRKDGAKNSHKVIDKIARYRGDNVKALATVHLSELLVTSEYENTTGEHNHQWLDERGWEYRKTYIQDRDGNIYEATLNIANGRDKRILYDVNNIRLIDKKRVARGVVPSTDDGRGSLTKSNSHGEIVAEQKPIVKGKSTETGILTDEEFQAKYGLKLRAVDEIGKSTYSQAVENTQGQKKPVEKFSVDSVGEEDFAAVKAAMEAQGKTWNEMYLRDQLGDEGYEKYRAWEKEQAEKQAEKERQLEEQRKQLAEQRKRQNEERKKERIEQRRRIAAGLVAESKPIEAKRELHRQMLGLFYIPEGRKAELGAVIDAYADRLIKNGTLDEEDRKHFFDRMYDAGVMTVPAEDYFSDAKDILRGGRVYVSDRLRQEFGDDWGDFRRRAFGCGIYFTDDSSAAGVDSWNHELAQELPGLFDSEETDMRSILERIVEIAEEGRDDRMSLPEYTALLAGQEHVSEAELLEDMERKMDEALRTFAKMAKLEIRLRDRTGRQIAKERAEHMEMDQRRRDREELRQLQEKTLKALQWLNRNRNRAPEELRARFEEVLGDIDLYAIGAANEMRWSNRYNATWRDLAQMYKDAQKNDPNFLPSKELEMIVARLDGEKIADMDLAALNDLYRAAVGLRTEFYNRNNVINDDLRRLFSEVYSDATTEIEEAPGGFSGKGADKLFNLEQLSPMNVLQRMGGWDPEGAFYSMAKQLERGERDMRAYSVKAKRMLQAFLTEHADWVKKADGQGKHAVWYEKEVPELLELGMGDKPIFGDTVTVYMTPAQKVHLYLESKNVDNLRHMTGGRTFADKKLYSEGKRQEALSQGKTIRLAPETVKALVKDLTAEEMELARLLEQYYNSFATSEINRISNILYGYDKAMGKNYAPIYTNRNYVKAEFGVFDQTAEGVGNLKGRQYAVNPSYNISAFDAFERHVDQTARFVGMAIPARNWTTLMNWRVKNNSMGDVITHKWGEESKKYITDLITTLQAGEDVKKDAVSKFMSDLQSTYITAIFGANPSIVLKQLGSVPLASAYLDAKNLPSPKQVHSIDRELIAKYTQDLAWRSMGYSMPETKQLKDNPNWTQTNKFYGFVFGGDAITAMDTWAASVLWPWAENKVRRDYPSLEVGTPQQVQDGQSPFYKKVAELFEDAVSRSQSTSDEIHQSSLRKSKSPVARAFTLFRSDSAQTYNALRQKIGEARFYIRTGATEQAKKRAKQAVGAVVISLAINALWGEAVSLLMAAWKNKDKKYRNEDGEWAAKKVIGEMVSGMLGTFAGIFAGGEELLEVIGNLLTGEKIYDIETPGMEQLNDIIEAVTTSGGTMRDVIKGAVDIAKNGGDLGKYFGDHAGELLGCVKELAETIFMYLPGLPASGIPLSNVEAYLLGAVKWISPELGMAYDDLFKNVGKSDLSGLSGSQLESRLGRILADRGVTESEETVRALATLYESGFKAAVPSDAPTSVTIDGEKRELGPHQQQAYEKTWSGIVADVIDELIESEGYSKATDKIREKMLNYLYSYASEMSKAELYEDYVPNTREDTVNAFEEAGMSMSDFLVAYGKYAEINAMDMKANMKAAEFAYWVNGQNFTNEQKAVIKQELVYYNMSPATAKKYEDGLSAGVDADDAKELLEKIEDAREAAGDEGLENVDRWRLCVDMFRDATDQLAALSMCMTDEQLAKAEMANKYGVQPKVYVEFCEIRKSYDEDGNGSYSQAEIKAAIDSMGKRCSTEQKAVLWQLATGAKSAKNNPYSTSVGQKIVDAKQKAKDAEAALPKLILGGAFS